MSARISSTWLEARVIENRHWTDSLFSLRAQLSGDAPRLHFQAGQFVRIALEENLARPFSFVNPPHDPLLEFYGIVVPEGPLSPRLAQLRAGERLLVASNPAGFLILPEVPPAKTLWLVSTGTGIAPFLSIVRTPEPWQRFANVVLVHAVRHARELVYQDTIRQISKAHALRYVTFVSREAAPGSLSGRIPAAIRDGRLEKTAGVALDAQTSHVMLCGNPDMLKDAQGALAERGLRKHRRRNPGHITVESFW